MEQNDFLSILKTIKRFLDENDLIGAFFLARKSKSILEKLCKQEILAEKLVFSNLEEYKLFLSTQFYLQGKNTDKIAKELAFINACQELLDLLNDMVFTTQVFAQIQKLRSLVPQVIQAYEDYLQYTTQTNKK